jgi:DNA-binding NtrC family response regulator
MSHDKLLIVEDDKNLRTALANNMERRGFRVSTAPNGSAALAWLEWNPCDLMLLDLQLPGMSGMDVLRETRRQHPSLEVVLLTGHGTIDTAIEAIRMGAFHYLTKPCPAEELEMTLKKAQERRGLVERTAILQDGLAPPDIGDSIVGRSKQFSDLLHMIDRVSRADSSVLITGETGVGKEVVARLIHTRSSRRDLPFVVVDCAGLHENLLQSELFGHERGAYTGATRLKHGLFEVANAGTAFLDEIGDISRTLQVKLLRVLEAGTFRRLGGTAEISVDLRLVAATHRPLDELVERGLFREDLYYRLNTIHIEVPPLRERREDIACLAAHFVSRFNQRFGADKELSPEAMEVLMAYPWPGNVRQLSNTIEQIVVLCEQPVITPACLPPAFRSHEAPGGSTSADSTIISLAQVERQYIEFVIGKLGGHRAKAARALGIGERSLYRKLKEYGID